MVSDTSAVPPLLVKVPLPAVAAIDDPSVDVFVVEQHCAYPELDGRDLEPGTVHLWVGPDGAPVAALRLLAEPGGGQADFEVIAGQGQVRIGGLDFPGRHEPQWLPERLGRREVRGWQAHFREVAVAGSFSAVAVHRRVGARLEYRDRVRGYVDLGESEGAKIIADIPLGRVASTDEVAEAIKKYGIDVNKPSPWSV